MGGGKAVTVVRVSGTTIAGTSRNNLLIPPSGATCAPRIGRLGSRVLGDMKMIGRLGSRVLGHMKMIGRLGSRVLGHMNMIIRGGCSGRMRAREKVSARKLVSTCSSRSSWT